MNKCISDKISLLINILTLASVLFAGSFWFFRTNELPKAVENHEQRIANIEKQIAENNVKTELIYQATLEIRRAIIYKK